MTIRVLTALAVALVASASAAGGSYDAYYGNYRVGPDHQIGIDRFITDPGDDAVLIADYQSGVVRRLFPVAEAEFVMGPGFDAQTPAELRVRFLKDATGAVSSLSLEPTNGATHIARRVLLTEHPVIIESGNVKLAGTLIVPQTKGPHPAIVLLHGSGPLTRYSFGPYPHFFTSLGFAVLIYDKRGTGASTGIRLDPATGRSTSRPAAYYPEDMLDDALAVLQFLRRRPGIDPRKVGLWGSSEGGMLTLQVAARDRDVAFAINSSGFVGPLSQTFLYQMGALMQAGGASAVQVQEAQELAKLWIKVSRTGQDYEKFRVELDAAREKKKPWINNWFNGEFTPEQVRWDWDHIISFDSVPALGGVTCPVLGVFGELDPMTDAAEASRAMQSALAAAGNRDFTVKVFRNAGHSLAEMPSGSRMAPGVFDTLGSWLMAHAPGTHR